MNTKLTPIGVAWDAWTTQRGGSGRVMERQRQRLAELFDHARAWSPFYCDDYRGLPREITNIQDLPPVTKATLMDRFDEWVTDPRVRRVELDHWIADLSNLGRDYLNQYLICTTSGSSGHLW